MSRPIIEVDGLSKRYRLGQLNVGSLREEAELMVRRLRGGGAVRSDADFWALRDVSFQVQPGEVLGVIGHNGAGKSTLLKILSRVTEPTAGEVRIRGRVASLLEVGTGFHPELTGRENIFLNGAILGMTRAEIAAKFDEIVDFAEVEKFLDTPVKRYSSGMYVRLAFAVAAHLEPDILIVDEVLAVGDYNFQRKCLGKMQELSGAGGRTTLFVSHNMNAVTSLCDNCVHLDGGQIVRAGDANTVTQAYLSEGVAGLSASYVSEVSSDEIDKAGVREVHFTVDNEPSNRADFRSRLALTVLYQLNVDLVGAHCTVEICKGDTVVFVSFDTDRAPELLARRPAGLYRTELELPRALLKPGVYTVNVGLGVPQGEIIDRVENAAVFEVSSEEYAAVMSYAAHRAGVVAVDASWRTKRVSRAA